ncbi:uncharacterized protein G2W53_016224 [Senna tora]|uniref:Transmembrane protein n=1 Tax=Senna tora TaxID=362788 RepID=A0A834TNL5_9FABA|nr:uncharacterized protein G2W53_016224 [Senna tora]
MNETSTDGDEPPLNTTTPSSTTKKRRRPMKMKQRKWRSNNEQPSSTLDLGPSATVHSNCAFRTLTLTLKEYCRYNVEIVGFKFFAFYTVILLFYCLILFFVWLIIFQLSIPVTI